MKRWLRSLLHSGELQKSNSEGAFEPLFQRFYLTFLERVFDRPLAQNPELAALLMDLPPCPDEQAQFRVSEGVLDALDPNRSLGINAPFAKLLTAAMDSCSQQYRRAGFESFVADRFEISPVEPAPLRLNEDFIHAKINHGFWEQIYSLYSSAIDPQRMRVTAPEIYRQYYVSSAFIIALQTALAMSAEPQERSLDLQPRGFALSLGNGAVDHADLIAGFQAASPFEQRVHSGAAIGAAAFFEAIYGPVKLHAHDGSFSKQGFSSGLLDSAIERKLQYTNRILFVVPPHLDGIHCIISRKTPQDCFLISGTRVHESWVGALYATSLRILSHLKDGENLMVFTQSGVFSALLGLFVTIAKRQCLNNEATLSFFDLGQLLDIANPHAGGPWLKTHNIERQGLFKI